MPQRTLPTDAAGNPKSQSQRNFTDPDSHILKGAVHLLPMLERIQSNTGQLPDAFIADAGYC